MIRVLVCLWIMNRRKKHHCSQQNKEITRRWNRHFSLHHPWMLGNRHFILHVDRLLIPDKRKELVHNKNQTIMSRLSSSPKTTLWDFPLPHHLSEMAFIHICFIKSCLFHSYHFGYHVIYIAWLSCLIYSMVITEKQGSVRTSYYLSKQLELGMTNVFILCPFASTIIIKIWLEEKAWVFAEVNFVVLFLREHIF